MYMPRMCIHFQECGNHALNYSSCVSSKGSLNELITHFPEWNLGLYLCQSHVKDFSPVLDDSRLLTIALFEKFYALSGTYYYE